MKKCKNCIYEQDKIILQTGGVIYWSATTPHPCQNCIRNEQANKPDNYCGKRDS